MKHGRSQPIKWQELHPLFEKALKNKYDGMRKDYNLWKSLKHGETGLGWNASTGQLNCSDEWWNKKIMENPTFKSFRKKQPSLELQQAWDQIFGDAVASGVDCVAPLMDASTFNDTHRVNLDNENEDAGDDAGTGDDAFFSSQYPQQSRNFENLGNEDVAYYSNLMNWASDELSPNNSGGSNQVGKSSKTCTKIKPAEMKVKKRDSAGAVLYKELLKEQTTTQKRTLELIEADFSPATQTTQTHDFSISAVVNLINRMVDDGILTKGSDLWCFAMSTFEDAVKRELFLSLPDDAGRLAWLEYK